MEIRLNSASLAVEVAVEVEVEVEVEAELGNILRNLLTLLGLIYQIVLVSIKIWHIFETLELIILQVITKKL